MTPDIMHILSNVIILSKSVCKRKGPSCNCISGFYCFSTTPTYGVKVVGGLVQECVERLQDLEAVLAGRGGAEGEGAGEEVVLHVDHEEGGAFCNKIGVHV